jgi:hypothetical protein
MNVPDLLAGWKINGNDVIVLGAHVKTTFSRTQAPPATLMVWVTDSGDLICAHLLTTELEVVVSCHAIPLGRLATYSPYATESHIAYSLSR